MLSQADLTEVIRIVAVARLLETGKWDEEIKRLLEATKVLTEQQGIVRTVAETKRLEALAAKKLYDVEARAKTLMDAVDREKIALRGREEKFLSSQTEFMTSSEEKNRRLAALDLELSNRQKTVVADEVALSARLAAVVRRETSLTTQESRLHEGEKALAERIANIKKAATA